MPRRKYYRRKGKVRYSKTKKMVTGHGPTLLEQVATGAGAAARVARAVMPVVSMINTEAKYWDATSSSNVYAPGTSDYIVNLTGGLLGGTTDTTRIGNSVLAQNIQVKGYVQWLASAAATTGLTRLIFMVWKENAQSNTPTAAKIFEAPGTFHSPYNKDYTDQFVVLKDKVFAHNCPLAQALVQQTIHFKWFKKLSFHMRWLDATATYTQNHVWMIVRGSGATSANQSTISFYSRMNYTDN